MAGIENLKPLNTRTKEEQREVARKGGIKSGESRRMNAEIRKRLTAALETTYRDKDTGKEVEGVQGIILALVGKAMNKKDKDQLNAIKYILSVLGADKSEADEKRQAAETKLIEAKAELITGTDTTALDKLDSILKEMKDNAGTKPETE